MLDVLSEATLWRPLLGWALLTALVEAALIVIGVASAPDALLHDYPPALQKRYRISHGRQSLRGRTADAATSMAMLLAAMTIAVIAIRHIDAVVHHTIGFVGGFTLGLASAVLLTVIDTVVIDWLMLCRLQLSIFILPYTDGDPAYSDYWFHVRVLWPGILLLLPATGFAYGLLTLLVEALA